MPKNPYTTSPIGNDLISQVKVSPEVVWEGDGTRFPHPGRKRVIEAAQIENYQVCIDAALL